MFAIPALSLAVLAFFLFYLKRKREHQVLKNLGIDGPKPHWFYGNLENLSTESPLSLLIQGWTKKYGKLFGYYEGPTPVIVISDPDMVQEVLVRNFSNFRGRRRIPLQDDPEKGRKVGMFNAVGHRWKRLRTSVNPAFTEVKMRNMYQLVKTSVDRILVKCDEISEEVKPVDIYDRFKRMTLDVICDCAFGITLDTQNNPSKLFEHVKHLFDVQAATITPLRHLVQSLPELDMLLKPVNNTLDAIIANRNRMPLILEGMSKVIELRKNDPSARRSDILQLLLEAETEEDLSADELSKSLSVWEVKQMSSMFLLAGYETTSTALAYLSYSLATNPEIQERLQAEVDGLFEELGEEAGNSYDHLGKLRYMNNLINETLRYYPIAPQALNRRCFETTKIGDLVIPKGALVMCNVYALHFDPDLWGPIDPEIFDPDRFEGHQKRHPSAWIPFGGGPRFCIGQRFALMEIRSTLFHMMRKFNIKTCSETQQPLKLKHMPTTTPKGKLMLVLEKRKC